MNRRILSPNRPVSPSPGLFSRFGPRSIRTRLMLWNVGALACVLAVLGVLISLTVSANLIASVDKDLKDRASHVHPRPPGPPPLGGPENGGPQEGPPGDEQPGPPPRPRNEPDEVISGRMPRVFNLDGMGRPPFQGQVPWEEKSFDRASRGEQTIETVIIDEQPTRLLSRPLFDNRPEGYRKGEGRRIEGVIQVIYPLAEINRAISQMNQTLLTLIPVALLFAGAGGAWMTGRALQPVRRITQTTAQIGAEDLGERLPVTGSDEFSELSITINGMLGRLESSFDRMERVLEEQRRFTADASHELKTPLTVIKANSSLNLATEPTESDFRESMGEIDRAANSMNRLVQDLLLLARGDEAQLGLNRTLVPVAELLNSVCARVQRVGSARVTVQANESLAVWGNPEELGRVFANLVENALRYTPGDGTVTLTATGTAHRTVITVADTGPGIAPEHLPHLCERFYRVDSARARADGGSGLGLAICKSLVEANGGTLHIASEVGKGTWVTVSLVARGS